MTGKIIKGWHQSASPLFSEIAALKLHTVVNGDRVEMPAIDAIRPPHGGFGKGVFSQVEPEPASEAPNRFSSAQASVNQPSAAKQVRGFAHAGLPKRKSRVVHDRYKPPSLSIERTGHEVHAKVPAQLIRNSERSWYVGTNAKERAREVTRVCFKRESGP